MAESGSVDCPCSNVTIMQLFHELKQKYPTVPDQIVSKVIQENCHDKNACESILKQSDNFVHLQSYPGAIISGSIKENSESNSLCTHCTALRPRQKSHVSESSQTNSPNDQGQPVETAKNGCSFPRSRGICRPSKTVEGRFKNDGSNIRAHRDAKGGLSEPNRAEPDCGNDGKKLDERSNGLPGSAETFSEPESVAMNSSTAEERSSTDAYESNSLGSSQFSNCFSVRKSTFSERSHSCDILKNAGYGEVETVRWKVEKDGIKAGGASGVIKRSVSSDQPSSHNYQVAVQYSMEPMRPGEQRRSFTTVNLNLRPPSTAPQPPIEIQTGQNLLYATSTYDSKQGVQSQFQIVINPGGGGTVSACRTYMSSPQPGYFCPSCYHSPQISIDFRNHDNHRLKALIEKQLERKDLLARELRKERDKLHCMRNEVRLMKASINLKPSPLLLPQLKAEIEKLRAECERLTSAVDLYSDTQNNLPLGETDEEFYRNIYTGQRLQREESWSCQLCTFRNHPLLNVCEECEMPRISLGTKVMDVATHLSNVLSNNNTPFCSAGGTSASASLITAPVQER